MKRRTRIIVATALALTAMLLRPRHAGDDGAPPQERSSAAA